MDHLESAALGVWVGAGSRSEREDEHGLSHLLEHMAFKGTATRTAADIAEEIEAVGGEVNAATSVETTSYYARVLKDDVPLALDILSDILRNSVFDADELEREQHVILQEIGAALDTPDDRVFDLFAEAAYPASRSAGRSSARRRRCAPSRRRCSRDYLDRHYRGPAMVLSAAGAVDHDRARRSSPAKASATSPADAGPQPVGARAIAAATKREERDLMEAQIMLGFEGAPYASNDFHTAQFSPRSSAAACRRASSRRCARSAGSATRSTPSTGAFADTGMFGIHAATGPDDVARADAGDHRRTGARRRTTSPSANSTARRRSSAPAC